MATQDSRIRLKRGTTTGDVPALGPSSDHTDGTWSATDIYVGEPYINTADNQVWVGFDSKPHCIYGHVKKTITSAEVLALNTTPIQFGMNVPAGYYAVPLNLVGVLNYGTVTFDTHADIAIRAVGATRNFGRVIGLLTATANTAGQWSMTGANAGDFQYVTGADIEVFSAADGTVGDSTVTLYLTYILIHA